MTGRSFAGWGRALRSQADPVVPDGVASVAGLLRRSGSMIVHAGGRSYGDPALNGGGEILLTGTLDRILDFDQETCIVSVEPGVTFRQLLAEFLPRGFLVPVTPGTGFATIGGAVALDVHGKNHEHAGSFGQHVSALDLVLPDGTTRTIGPQSDAVLFRATCGGLGLTGIVTRICFRMKRVPGDAVAVREERAENLEQLLDLMDQRADEQADAEYSVAWIDGTARGAGLGRGILQTAQPVPGTCRAGGLKLAMPFDLPRFVLNPVTVGAFNALYYRRVPKCGRTLVLPWSTFLYPLDMVRDWNRIYGAAGFHQFQAVIPHAAAKAGLRALLDVAATSRQASFLAVLKRLGPGRAGCLSFPMPGYTLALDFPAQTGTAALYAKLVAITRDFAGRVYLAKDALMTPEDVRAMYPELKEFQRLRRIVDPGDRLRSDMARRLQL